MKKLMWLGLLVALAGCQKVDEDAKTKAEIEQVYKSKAEAALHKPANIGDVTKGAELAKQCAQCHGLDGIAGNAGAPFIAGVEQSYLVSSLLAYKDGSRKNTDMQKIVSHLTPDEIGDVSDYYASLKTNWHGEHIGMRKQTGIALDKHNVASGAELAAQCNSCHGANGNSEKNREIPALAAMPPEYFVYALKSYFNGKRDHKIMSLFKASLPDSKVQQLAAYYALQTPAKPPKPLKGSYKAGEAAAAECAGCHGFDGNSLNPAIPHLAGHPSEYLVTAMKYYRDGVRKDKLMGPVLHKMSDSKIDDLAAYYSQQTPESPLKNRQLAIKTFDPIAQGKKIADSCNGCHGPEGNSIKAGVPSLTGLGVKYFVNAGLAYRDGVRKHDVMTKMVSSLEDSDFEKAAFYYGLQTPVNNKKVAEFDAKAGAKIGEDCANCHGKGGVSTDSKTPSLAGQDADYLAAAIRAYAKGQRPSDAMKSPAEALKEQDIINVARYFASQTNAKPNNNLPAQPQLSIVEKCNRCHGDNGNSTEMGIPSLAGQSETYLALALKEYQDGRRKNKYMNAMSDVLSIVEIKAIAAYYAKQERKQP